MSDSYVFVSAAKVLERANFVKGLVAKQYEDAKTHCYNTIRQSETVGWFWWKRKVNDKEAHSLMRDWMNNWESPWSWDKERYTYINHRLKKFIDAAVNTTQDLQLSFDDNQWLFSKFDKE